MLIQWISYTARRLEQSKQCSVLGSFADLLQQEVLLLPVLLLCTCIYVWYVV